MKAFFLLVCMATMQPSAAETAPPQQPGDVARFQEDADSCIHLSGEISGERSAEQRKLVKQINRYCDSAKRQLKRLDKKYKDNAKVQEQLKPYREDLI
ncbi:hypothetical protein [Chromobacterium sp. IIBBL 290-4]|uniref:hypothetical protein n=1 Tax=Chromobacterium sp. IIBBL 290-4 TaxID=2953890 RepID=UPI0020B63FF5|nr:hypothetical protein [Chromobacterium sp. IIBBL 290-4]UTH73980.1 hypothetical protein NKT35_20925 [Chromobacterium sp. IIBBL 290-4]